MLRAAEVVLGTSREAASWSQASSRSDRSWTTSWTAAGSRLSHPSMVWLSWRYTPWKVSHRSSQLTHRAEISCQPFHTRAAMIPPRAPTTRRRKSRDKIPRGIFHRLWINSRAGSVSQVNTRARRKGIHRDRTGRPNSSKPSTTPTKISRRISSRVQSIRR